MKLKRILCLVLSLVLLAGLLAGCGEKKSDENELREINVVLDWYPNALHAFLYTANERGYFADEGLDVKIRFPSNENDALSLVSAGRAEIGLYYEHDI
ncbi:MAG: ABC transporter substrate-binding protein, partial [Clostridia bacterium]|nr:ABC transporter substrate-binding protein [Clostridia bacterium]